MTLERLYTPWRLAYVTGAAKSSDCVFCAALSSADADPLIVFRGTTAFVILNLFPYNNGHLMVVPNRHIATLVDAAPDELCEMMELTRHTGQGAVVGRGRRRQLKPRRTHLGSRIRDAVAG